MTHRRHRGHSTHRTHHRLHKYTNLTLVGISIIVALTLSRVEGFHALFLHLGTFGYLGAFFAGMLFVSTFTVATGALMLLLLAETYSHIEIGLIAGLGAVIGDLFIFHVVKDNLLEELSDLYHQFGGKHFTHILHTAYFRWSLPVIGAIIIASPLPDELGVSLMGISKMNTYRFALVSYLLNSAGIFLILSASTVIKP
ncbi:hypothetical protein A2Z00_03650 [Candidatus Gottesmanbacteria bacterium RBG_13_45_10]|uniref:SNARE associated Golgi protein n=1 Tax=Candidatus Gottesmanbacteria bacterium RBG_13_45_10 TaxID=1798370 RepID=A0A1F5ZHW7_9BACT|nr:MAG: hypothetical protein A2Z00_03650 [Candidatus Gottesmanbacteria bacterium RBG_13_45_10]